MQAINTEMSAAAKAVIASTVRLANADSASCASLSAISV
jgi:hypothetical protein